MDNNFKPGDLVILEYKNDRFDDFYMFPYDKYLENERMKFFEKDYDFSYHQYIKAFSKRKMLESPAVFLRYMSAFELFQEIGYPTGHKVYNHNYNNDYNCLVLYDNDILIIHTADVNLLKFNINE